MLHTVFCALCLHQTSDPGSSERGCRAKCGTASHAFFNQSAESRKRSDHCWHHCSRNLSGQLQWGPESRPGTSLNMSQASPVGAGEKNITQHQPFHVLLLTGVLCFSSPYVSWWRQRRWKAFLRWSSPPIWETERPIWSRLVGSEVWSTTL